MASEEVETHRVEDEGFGFTEKDDYFGNMVREGMITRGEALNRLRNDSVVPQKAITELCDEIGLSLSDLNAGLERARKSTLRKK